MPLTDLRAALAAVLPDGRVHDDPAALAAVAEDMTENPAGEPALVVDARTVAEVQGVVRACRAARTPLVPRVAGTNVGGLTIPARGAVVLDLAHMDQIVEVNEADLYAVVEPGVTWEGLKRHLDERQLDLVVGYPLSPPDSSVMANCLLDGLGNLSFAHGSMADWISGLEVVLPDGSLARTGAAAAGRSWCSRGPLPDLTGLFVGFQGTTGVVTKMGLQLWPRPRHRRRLFVLCYEREAAIAAMRELSRARVADDVGGLSWPTGKLLLGVEHPAPRDPDEPDFFLYVDLSGYTPAALEENARILGTILKDVRAAGHGLEDPIAVPELVAIEPRLAKFADFPTRLDFLLDHPGGGLTWVGTYGPLSRLEEGAAAGQAVLDRFGYPPILVSRPMKGGHFAVLRYILTFDKKVPAEVARAREATGAMLDAILPLGFIPYKTPGWAVDVLKTHLDPGFQRLVREVKRLLDPDGIMNPGRWEV
ncbi:MAG TPA: FAD-binding oxidoreductase [Polyangia bacterium]|jgi:glycolate oxidase